MDKFYQPNSGLRSSRSLDEAIYTYMCVCIYGETIKLKIQVHLCVSPFDVYLQLSNIK